MHQAYKKAAVLAIITLLGWGGIHSYYRYNQDMIYQESTDSLRATYTQVGTSFRLFTQRNWNILSVYEKNIQLLPAEYRTNEQWKVLLGERSQWKYRDFYLFDQAGNFVTDRGSRGQTDSFATSIFCLADIQKYGHFYCQKTNISRQMNCVQTWSICV